ncbi:uncharacterized protein LOC131695701 isoform X1 [Topomyia yanbarensis]|uniref:uncharacterized protein LOC131695701 isoform X1 n=1 Tax=Topomyia yanbarensis TaxID=2498891 RepID=UPI00273B509B|nr:uncharacterized protein LOC131695701 isoform X1 [Topomyia yanbarensis]
MDSFVKNNLLKWNLGDLVERFCDEEVNEEAFMVLTEDIIKELIPKLGKRAIFIARYTELKNSLGNQLSPACSQVTKSDEKKPVRTVEIVPAPSSTQPYQKMTVERLEMECENDYDDYLLDPDATSYAHVEDDNACDPFFEVEIEGEPSEKRFKLEIQPEEQTDVTVHGKSNESDEDFTGFPEKPADNSTAEKLSGAEKLRRLLAESPLNRNLLGLETLDNVQRIQLTNAVVNYLVVSSPNGKVSAKMFAHWAKLIEEVFPSETAQLYYGSSHKDGRNGRLIERYSYLRSCKPSELAKLTEQRKAASVAEKSFVDFDTYGDDSSTDFPFDDSDSEMNALAQLKKIVSSCSIMKNTLAAQFLTPNQRTILSANIISYLMFKHNGDAPIEDMKNFAEAIEVLYPKENASIYYRRPKNRGRVHGKLADRFGYVKASITRREPRRLFAKKSPISKLQEMHTVVEAKPTWNEIYEFRKNMTRKLSPIKILELFPALSQSDGYLLFLEDFNREYPDTVNNFSKHWPTYASSIFRYIEQNKFMEGVTEYNIDKYEEDIQTSMLILLPLLFKPPIRSAKYWSPTRLEVADSFILHAKVFRDAVDALRRRRKTLERYKLRLTPVVVAIGPTLSTIESCFIVIQHVFYKFEKLQKAIEVCIKIYATLGARYLDEVSAPWVFVQRFVMKVELPTDNISSKIFALLEAMDLPLR